MAVSYVTFPNRRSSRAERPARRERKASRSFAHATDVLFGCKNALLFGRDRLAETVRLYSLAYELIGIYRENDVSDVASVKRGCRQPQARRVALNCWLGILPCSSAFVWVRRFAASLP